MTKIWLKLQLHFSQKTTTKTKLKSAVKINTADHTMLFNGAWLWDKGEWNYTSIKQFYSV